MRQHGDHGGSGQREISLLAGLLGRTGAQIVIFFILLPFLIPPCGMKHLVVLCHWARDGSGGSVGRPLGQDREQVTASSNGWIQSPTFENSSLKKSGQAFGVGTRINDLASRVLRKPLKPAP